MFNEAQPLRCFQVSLKCGGSENNILIMVTEHVMSRRKHVHRFHTLPLSFVSCQAVVRIISVIRITDG